MFLFKGDLNHEKTYLNWVTECHMPLLTSFPFEERLKPLDISNEWHTKTQNRNGFTQKAENKEILFNVAELWKMNLNILFQKQNEMRFNNSEMASNFEFLACRITFKLVLWARLHKT